MKKMKRLVAILLTMAMILGMSLTTLAATDISSPYQATITVNGLSANDATTVNVFKAIYLNEAENEWLVAEWAKPYVEVSGTAYTIKNKAALSKVAAKETPVGTKSTDGTSVEFESLPVGAYVIVAAGTDTVYNPMVAETYKGDETYMTAEDKTIVAKTSSYGVDKEVDDHFVQRGQKVNFTVTTNFPSFEDPTATNKTYKITDTPVNLDIYVESVVVKLGSGELVKDTDYEVSKDTNGVLLVDLSKKIGDANEHAGKVVTITYTAMVTGVSRDSDETHTFDNTVVARRNDAELGSDSEHGFSGDIVLTKTDNADEPKPLIGAEFELYETANKEAAADKTLLYFVKESVGLYRLAKSTTEADATTKLETEAGSTVKVIGLDEGTYWFKETKAPAGYTINSDGVAVTIENPEEDGKAVMAHIHKTTSLQDTKLVELPSTGGIGTTIFTIVGCLIMVAAVGMFFVSRRRENI